jgi:hypothetical protein
LHEGTYFAESMCKSGISIAPALKSIASLATVLSIGCSTSAPPKGTGSTTPTVDAGPLQYTGSFKVALWGFLDGAVMGTGRPSEKPENTYVDGQVYDGPYPERLIETQLPLPLDATPGCAVYSVAPPSCLGINGCGADSDDLDCAAAAFTKPCVCAAQDRCESYPTALNAGEVTVAGVSDIDGNRTWSLANAANTYRVPESLALAYPGFSEGDTLTLSAAGKDCPPFSISAPGVSPLIMSRDTYSLVRDKTSNDPYAYDALEISWAPPTIAGNTSIFVEIDISRHAGTIGFLGCEVQDSGSLSISSSLVSQLVELGNIGGYAELAVGRVISTSIPLGLAGGQIDLEVSSANEYVIGIEGYASCMQDSDCQTGQICNRSIKLCASA